MAYKQDNPWGYMDGVRVKISEKSKPPPRINLAMSYAQRLSLNKQIQDNMPRYDFALDRAVRDKMGEWRSARSAMHDELAKRLGAARAKQQEQQEEKSKRLKIEEELTTTESGQNYTYTSTSPPILMPTRVTAAYSNILKPIPLSENAQNCAPSLLDKSPFNLSDFEADTSSPFDNVALKSINDMEELAQVLTVNDNPAPPSYANQQNYVNYATGPGFFNIPNSGAYIQQPPIYRQSNGYYAQAPGSFSSSRGAVQYVYSNENAAYGAAIANSTVPDIVKSLNAKLDSTHLDDRSRPRPAPSDSLVDARRRTSDDANEMFSSLPKSMQDTTKSISSMGFPLSRVARVCKLLGNDQKKIVDHLLVMSELLDLGFAETTVSDALVKTDNDRDKALDILTS